MDKADILKLLNEKRILAACSLYEELKSKQTDDDNSFHEFEEKHQIILNSLIEKAKKVRAILNSGRMQKVDEELDNVKNNDNVDDNKDNKDDDDEDYEDDDAIADDEDEWLPGSTLFGVITKYKKLDNGLISVLIQGKQEDLPIFEQMTVLHEIDLYKEFIPLCNKSLLIDYLSPSELIAYLNVSAKLVSRDVGIYAYGADCLQEASCVVLVGTNATNDDDDDDNDNDNDSNNSNSDNTNTNSNSNNKTKKKKIPFKKAGWGHQTIDVKEFNAVIEVISPTCAKTSIICTVDLKVMLPNFIINFVIRNLAGVLLYVIQNQANHMTKNLNCKHSKRIRENKDFYLNWLLPKLHNLCEIKGWEKPQNIQKYFEDGIDNDENVKTIESDLGITEDDVNVNV